MFPSVEPCGSSREETTELLKIHNPKEKPMTASQHEIPDTAAVRHRFATQVVPSP